MRLRALLVAVLVTFGIACTGWQDRLGRRSDIDSTELARREARLIQAKSSPDSGQWGAPLAKWVLPQSLAEISGLALTADGRMFGHPDERAIVSEIDYRRGVVLKQFLLGRRGVTADFEGIAIVGDTMFLMTSSGKLYEFREGANGANVDYSIHDTELGKECEFEGLAYDPAINSLLLACKKVGIKELKDHLVIFRWRLSEDGGERLSRMTTPIAPLLQEYNWKDVSPTAIEVDPLSGNYVVITAEHGLITLNPEGQIVESRLLPVTHDQPEGIAITADSMLIISDEAVTRPATITLYRWP